MALKLITPASTYPVTLAEAKLHLRVDGTDEDALISALITSATEGAEQMTGRAIMSQTWELTLDAFPDAFELTRVPVVSVTSVKYYDSAAVQQTMLNTLYTLDNTDDFGYAYVVPAYATTWPTTNDQINSVVVRYVCGYASAAAVPEPIKSWIKLQLGAMYANRECEVIERGNVLKLGFVDALLARYRVY